MEQQCRLAKHPGETSAANHHREVNQVNGKQRLSGIESNGNHHEPSFFVARRGDATCIAPVFFWLPISRNVLRNFSFAGFALNFTPRLA